MQQDLKLLDDLNLQEKHNIPTVASELYTKTNDSFY